MKKLVLFCLVVLVCFVDYSCGQQCKCGIEQIRRRIINGREARKGQYPWMASVQSTMGSCGGSVINDRYVMTAAHCVQGVKSANDMKVILGAYYTEDFNRLPKVKVKRIVKHEKYTGIESLHDIALLELVQPLRFNNTFMPVCIANYRKYDNLVVTGWGLMNLWILKVQSPTLREADLPEVPIEKCRQTYGDFLDDKLVICAGGNKGSCNGDSGGPLMTRRNGQTYQVGIVSFGGRDCGTITKSPSVFERPQGHIDWIRRATQGAQWCDAPYQAVSSSQSDYSNEVDGDYYYDNDDESTTNTYSQKVQVKSRIG